MATLHKFATIVDTRLIITSQYYNKVLRLGYDPIMSFISGKSLIVVL